MSDNPPESTPCQRPPTKFATWLSTLVPGAFDSDAELARALGIGQHNITRWRQGTVPSVPMLSRLARVTGTRAEILLHIAGYPPEDGPS